MMTVREDALVREAATTLATQAMREWQSDILDDLEDALKGLLIFQRYTRGYSTTIVNAAAERHIMEIRRILGEFQRLQIPNRSLPPNERMREVEQAVKDLTRSRRA